MFEWFSNNDELLSNLSTWIGALATIISSVVAYYVFKINASLEQLARYANKQNDRAIIEEIHSLQRQAQKVAFSQWHANELESTTLLVRAKTNSELYSLHEITRYLDACIKKLGQAYILYSEIYDDNGERMNYATKNMLDEYHQCKRESRKMLSNVEIYRKYLKIE